MDEIRELRRVIRRLHGCSASHVNSVPVRETFNGQTAWEGDVEIFKLHRHARAQRCYAWSYAVGDNEKDRRYVVVLDLPPVVSAETAVKAAIVAEFKDTGDRKRA